VCCCTWQDVFVEMSLQIAYPNASGNDDKGLVVCPLGVLGKLAIWAIDAHHHIAFVQHPIEQS